MIMVNVSEAKARLTELLHLAEAGERVVIARRNEPIAELHLVEPGRVPEGKRPLGLCRGEFEVPEDFDAALPDEILRDFEGL